MIALKEIDITQEIAKLQPALEGAFQELERAMNFLASQPIVLLWVSFILLFALVYELLRRTLSHRPAFLIAIIVAALGAKGVSELLGVIGELAPYALVLIPLALLVGLFKRR